MTSSSWRSCSSRLLDSSSNSLAIFIINLANWFNWVMMAALLLGVLLGILGGSWGFFFLPLRPWSFFSRWVVVVDSSASVLEVKFEDPDCAYIQMLGVLCVGSLVLSLSHLAPSGCSLGNIRSWSLPSLLQCLGAFLSQLLFVSLYMNIFYILFCYRYC